MPTRTSKNKTKKVVKKLTTKKTSKTVIKGDNMSGDLPEKLQVANYMFVERYRYFSSALYSCRFVEVANQGLDTMASDKYWRVYYDPKCIERWTVPQIVDVLYHEIGGHLVRDHANRCGSRDHFLFNVASDIEINQEDVKNLPDGGGMQPGLFGFPPGLVAEEYYEKLQKMPKKKVSVCQPGHNGKGCGSSSNGGEKPWELPQEGETKDGQTKNKGLSEQEQEVLRRKVAQDVKDYKKSRGNLPAGLEWWADSVLEPIVDWVQELSSVVANYSEQKKGCQDYSYRRPHKRQCTTPIILPVMMSSVLKIGFQIDTSGSMSNEELTQSLAEVSAVLSAFQNEIALFSGDTRLETAQNIVNISQAKLGGRGGTDMMAVLDQIVDRRQELDVVIIITDGETEWRHVETPFEVLVCLTSSGLSYKDKIPYRTIVMDNSRNGNKQ